MHTTYPIPNSWFTSRLQIEEALSQGSPPEAFRLISPWISRAEASFDPESWKQGLNLLARIAAAQSLESLSSASMQAEQDPEASTVLFQLGHSLIETNLPGLAAGVLRRARLKFPGDAAILAELVAALELEGRNQEAVDALDSAGDLVESSILLTYLRAFNGLLTADIHTAESLLPRLQASKDEQLSFMVRRLERMLSRVEALRGISSLSPTDLRGWHFVLTGSLLLQHARTNRKDGRYGKTWDSNTRVLEGVRSLSAVLDTWKIPIPTILFPPERNSEILAHAIAGALGRPAKKWFGGSEPGLITIYDPSLLIPELLVSVLPKHHFPGQALFVHAISSSREHRTAPDLLTYFYESNTTPWGAGLDPDNNYIEPVEGSAEFVANLIWGAELPDGAQEDLTQLVSFAQMLYHLPSELQPAALQKQGEREPLWRGSPVNRDH